MKNKCKIICLVLSLLFATVVNAASFPTGSFTILGRAFNYNHDFIEEADDVLLELVNTNGVVVSQCNILSPTENNYNFRISVPISSSSTSNSVVYGEKLTLIAKQAGRLMQISTSEVTVGEANSAMIAELVFASYTDPSKKVPDEYIAEYEAWIKANEDITGGEYDPNADWDGDGFDNYSEYIAGTSPIDASDFLRITSIELEKKGGEDVVAVSFEYSGSRIYGIKGSANAMDKGEYMQFATEKSVEPSNKVWLSPAGDYDVKTFYMTPIIGSEDKAFFYIGVNPEVNSK